MIPILLIAAASLLAPTSAPANGIEIIRVPVADPNPGAPDARRSGPPLAENAALPQNIAGIYAGKVERRYLVGEPRATRTMNPDMNTGKVLIYDPDGKLLSELGVIGKMTDERTFEGTTVVIDAAPHGPTMSAWCFLRMAGASNGYHNDGTVEGSGRLSRAAE